MRVSWHRGDDLMAAARERIADVDVLLDVGCGIRPQTLTAARVHLCCEPFRQYATKLQQDVRSANGRRLVVLQLSWADALRALPDRSVDSVFLLDVIEHLEKAEGAALLRETERIVRRQIVLFTPLGFMPQPHTGTRDAWGLDGGDVQQHRSGWTPDDFDDTWRILASRDYHRVDSLGQHLAEPFGAFFAIKELSATDAASSREAHLERLMVEGAAIGDMGVLERTLRLVRSARRVNIPAMLAPAQLALDLVLALRDSPIGRLAHRAVLWARRSPR